jgi:hypothetical protein
MYWNYENNHEKFLMYFLTYDIMFFIHTQNVTLKFNSYAEKKREILLESILD